MQGTIVRLKEQGFGFIGRGQGQKDLFFHANELKGVRFDELREGDNVTYDVSEGPKGPCAVNVTRV